MIRETFSNLLKPSLSIFHRNNSKKNSYLIVTGHRLIKHLHRTSLGQNQQLLSKMLQETTSAKINPLLKEDLQLASIRSSEVALSVDCNQTTPTCKTLTELPCK